MVKKVEDYPWSGHLAYLGEETLPWLQTEWVLGQLAKRIGTARRRYQLFVESALGEGHRKEFHRGTDDTRVLANDRYLNKVLKEMVKPNVRKPSLNHVVKTVAKVYGLDEKALSAEGRGRREAEARAVIGWLCQKTAAVTLEAVASRFNRDASTLSRQVGEIEKRQRGSRSFGAELRRCLNTVTQA